jgi:hypothetical protein
MAAEPRDIEDIAREAVAAAERAGAVARVSLIIACMAIAVAILGLFLPI